MMKPPCRLAHMHIVGKRHQEGARLPLRAMNSAATQPSKAGSARIWGRASRTGLTQEAAASNNGRTPGGQPAPEMTGKLKESERRCHRAK